ncbi:MAG: DUF4397 domain-containing protein [Lacibacter sp.]
MKKKIGSYTLLLAALTLFGSCKKNNLDDYEAAKDVDATKTQVRFIHAFSSNTINTVSPVTITTAPPAFAFHVNGVRLNGVVTPTTSPSWLTFYFGAFPGVNTASPTTNGSNGSLNTGGVAASTILPDYAVLPGGTMRVAAVLNRFTGASPADTVIANTVTLDNGKRYTLIAGDTIPNQRFFVFEDNWTRPAPGNYQIRIINMAPAITHAAFDVFSRRQARTIATNVAYRSGTNYAEFPVRGTLDLTNDTLEFRPAGTPTTVVQFNGFFPVSERVYTFVVRGLSNLPTTNVRTLAVAGYLNR